MFNFREGLLAGSQTDRRKLAKLLATTMDRDMTQPDGESPEALRKGWTSDAELRRIETYAQSTGLCREFAHMCAAAYDMAQRNDVKALLLVGGQLTGARLLEDEEVDYAEVEILFILANQEVERLNQLSLRTKRLASWLKYQEGIWYARLYPDYEAAAANHDRGYQIGRLQYAADMCNAALVEGNHGMIAQRLRELLAAADMFLDECRGQLQEDVRWTYFNLSWLVLAAFNAANVFCPEAERYMRMWEELEQKDPELFQRFRHTIAVHSVGQRLIAAKDMDELHVLADEFEGMIADRGMPLRARIPALVIGARIARANGYQDMAKARYQAVLDLTHSQHQYRSVAKRELDALS